MCTINLSNQSIKRSCGRDGLVINFNGNPELVYGRIPDIWQKSDNDLITGLWYLVGRIRIWYRAGYRINIMPDIRAILKLYLERVEYVGDIGLLRWWPLGYLPAHGQFKFADFTAVSLDAELSWAELSSFGQFVPFFLNFWMVRIISEKLTF